MCSVDQSECGIYFVQDSKKLIIIGKIIINTQMGERKFGTATKRISTLCYYGINIVQYSIQSQKYNLS